VAAIAVRARKDQPRLVRIRGRVGAQQKVSEEREQPVATQAVAPEATVERRRDLDLLRVLLVFGLVFFHTARIFDVIPLPEGVKNEPPSVVATILVAFFGLWGMPLMMAVAGFAIWHSLRRRTATVFVRERLQRLVVPFVLGVLVIVPPQVYYHLKQVDPGSGLTYWRFLPQFFDVRLCPDLVNAFICPGPETALFTTAHLWFLKDLFIFSVLLLPLFLFLRGQRGERAVGFLAGFLARPGTILLLALPVGLVEAALVTSTMGGGWNEYTYAVLLALGFLIAADKRFGQAMGRGWRIALVAGLAAEAIYVTGLYLLLEVDGLDPLHDYNRGSVLWRLVKGMGAWFWVVAILGFGSRPRPVPTPKDGTRPLHTAELPGRPSLGTRVIAYAGEAFLAVYILHQTIVFVIGYYVVQWQAAALLKFFVISLVALALTLLLYEFGVRRTRATRWLFGMRPE
jgi:fucose 4-O-acetylase-like acetyltransferase